MIADVYAPTRAEVVAVDPRTFVPRLLPAHPFYVRLGVADSQASLAFQVAVVAHAALGQRRRDPGGREQPVPYIVHPVHVAALALGWAERLRRVPDVREVGWHALRDEIFGSGSV